jgi:uncharacterized membrane protein required for colicin V production
VFPAAADPVCPAGAGPVAQRLIMNVDAFSVSWVDFAVLLLLLVGIARGRKRGMSAELLDMIKWFLIVVVAGFLYEPSGRLLSQSTMFSLLACYIAVYAVVALVILSVFSFLRQRVGEKLQSKDLFGDAEYYLGMVGGAFRYGCILLVILAVLNARYFTPQEVRAQEHFQTENFGSIRFPTLIELQKEVFDKSLTGRLARGYLGGLLIRPISPEGKEPEDVPSYSGRRRERGVNEILEKK